MKHSLLILACLTGSLVSSQVNAANLDHLFQNTIQLTTTVGERTFVSALMYQEDGTITNADGAAGSWKEDGASLCTTLSNPNGPAQTACSPMSAVVATKVGDDWVFSPAEGISIQGTLLPGR